MFFVDWAGPLMVINASPMVAGDFLMIINASLLLVNAPLMIATAFLTIINASLMVINVSPVVINISLMVINAPLMVVNASLMVMNPVLTARRTEQYINNAKPALASGWDKMLFPEKWYDGLRLMILDLEWRAIYKRAFKKQVRSSICGREKRLFIMKAVKTELSFIICFHTYS